MKHFYLLLSLCAMSFSVAAQDSSPKSEFEFFGFQTRYLMTDFSDFTNEVTSIGYAGLDDNLIEYSITAGQQSAKRVSTVGVSWVRPDGKGNTPQTQYKHLMVESETTYSFLRKNRTSLGLSLGLGARWANLMFISEEETETAQGALNIDFRKFKNFGIPIWAGLDLDTILGKKEGGVRIGFGAGYRYDRVRRWRIEDAATWKTRNVDLSGFYLVGRIGIAGRDGFKKDKKMKNTRL